MQVNASAILVGPAPAVILNDVVPTARESRHRPRATFLRVKSLAAVTGVVVPVSMAHALASMDRKAASATLACVPGVAAVMVAAPLKVASATKDS